VGPSSSLDRELSTGANRRGGACLKRRCNCPLTQWLSCSRLDETFVQESRHGDPDDDSSFKKKTASSERLLAKGLTTLRDPVAQLIQSCRLGQTGGVGPVWYAFRHSLATRSGGLQLLQYEHLRVPPLWNYRMYQAAHLRQDEDVG
jgi:hypothetical protein